MYASVNECAMLCDSSAIAERFVACQLLTFQVRVIVIFVFVYRRVTSAYDVALLHSCWMIWSHQITRKSCWGLVLWLLKAERLHRLNRMVWVRRRTVTWNSSPPPASSHLLSHAVHQLNNEPGIAV